MGSDNLHHKRKARTAEQLARRKASRASYGRLLIVCEGSKTEPNYFCELVSDLELNSANVEIDGDCDSSPMSVAEYAKKRYVEEKRTGNGFDKVFCVFDKDSHTTYEEALRQIKSMKPKDTFIAITSIPCFEYWLLLHFDFTTRPFETTGTKSSCYNLIDELKNYLPNYDKGESGIYRKISVKTNQAIAWSVQSLEQAGENHTDNPSTHVHKLVSYLVNLKKTI